MSQTDSIPFILKRVFRLLIRQERKKSGWLLASIVASSIVEILGLAVIVPVIGLVVRPEAITEHQYLRRLYGISNQFGIDTPVQFLMVLCVLMVAAFVFKALFGLLVNLFQTRFAFSVAYRLTGDVWTFHFTQSLERMRSSASGRLLAEINLWPIQFAQAFMVGGLLVLSEITIVFIMSLGLLWYNPIVFLSVATIMTIGTIAIRLVTRNRLAKYSNVRRELEPRSNTLVTDSIRGFLEVLTFRASDAVRDAYLNDRQSIFRVQGNTTVLNLMPTRLYEVLAVLAISGSIIIALFQDTPQDGFLQLLTFMAISAYRIMPSLSRINTSIMTMRSQHYVLDVMEVATQKSVVKGMEELHLEVFSAVDIHVKDITIGYESLDTPVIKGLTASFHHGKIHGIVGTSGSGKSSLIASILGLHPLTHGTIQYVVNKNESLASGDKLNLHQWLFNLGYLSQSPFLFQGSARDNLTLRVPGANLDEAMINQLVDELELRECLGADHMEFQIQEGGSNLSGGQQQRLALLRALQVRRPLLILDEATSALDAELRDVVFNILRQRAAQGTNIIMVTHDSVLAGECDSVLDLGVAGGVAV